MTKIMQLPSKYNEIELSSLIDGGLKKSTWFEIIGTILEFIALIISGL